MHRRTKQAKCIIKEYKCEMKSIVICDWLSPPMLGRKINKGVKNALVTILNALESLLDSSSVVFLEYFGVQV